MAMTFTEKVDMVRELIGEEPDSYATKYYGKDYGALFRDRLSDKILEIVKTCTYNRDSSRSYLRYSQDVTLAWIVEDFFEKLLIKLGYKVRRNGTDKKRQFIKGEAVSGVVDFILEKDGIIYHCEAIFDWSGFWYNEQRGDMRDSKLPNLIKLSEKENVILFCGDIRHKRYGFLEINTHTPARKRTIKAWGNKVVYDTDIPSSIFTPISSTI